MQGNAMLKVDKILHPTDFSDCSREAFSWSVFLARELQAELQMLHVVAPVGAGAVDLASHFPTPDQVFEEIRRTAQVELSELAKSQRSEQLRIRDVIRHGHHAGPSIIDHAAEEDVDLIVMGTHGRRAAAQLLMGSAAQEVVRGAPCPVVCVRAADEPGQAPAVHRVLAPLDLADEDAEALTLAMDVAARFDATLWLLHVVDDRAWRGVIGGGPIDELLSQMENLEELAGSRLDQLVAASGYTGPVEIRSLVGKPSETILEFAQDNDIDLIVLQTRGRSGLEHVLLGSTTERVLRLAPCPILTVRPAAKMPTGA